MKATNEGLDTLNSLLRGEISATETYQQALDKMKDQPGAVQLRHLHSEHQKAVQTLREHIRDCGGEPETSSGVWGSWAMTVEGTAKVFGNTSALRALKEGEERGAKDYEDALHSNTLSEQCATMIQSRLLPQTQTHIKSLDQLMSVQ